MYVVFLSDFIQIWIFSPGINRNLQYHIQQKSVLWEPSPYMWTDRQTDRHDKLMGTFHGYAGVSNKVFTTVLTVYSVPVQCNQCQQAECLFRQF